MNLKSMDMEAILDRLPVGTKLLVIQELVNQELSAKLTELVSQVEELAGQDAVVAVIKAGGNWRFQIRQGSGRGPNAVGGSIGDPPVKGNGRGKWKAEVVAGQMVVHHNNSHVVTGATKDEVLDGIRKYCEAAGMAYRRVHYTDRWNYLFDQLPK